MPSHPPACPLFRQEPWKRNSHTRLHRCSPLFPLLSVSVPVPLSVDSDPCRSFLFFYSVLHLHSLTAPLRLNLNHEPYHRPCPKLLQFTSTIHHLESSVDGLIHPPLLFSFSHVFYSIPPYLHTYIGLVSSSIHSSICIILCTLPLFPRQNSHCNLPSDFASLLRSRPSRCIITLQHKIQDRKKEKKFHESYDARLVHLSWLREELARRNAAAPVLFSPVPTEVECGAVI